jgi:hypothetical protein
MGRTVWLVQTDVAKYHSSPVVSNLLVMQQEVLLFYLILSD